MTRTVTKTDKVLIAASLVNAGVKARIRQFPAMVRVVFAEGDRAAVAQVLADEGYRNVFFQDNQAHVRYAEV